MSSVPIPSIIIKPSTTFGRRHDVGRSKRYAREDHDHGSPGLTSEAVAEVLQLPDTFENEWRAQLNMQQSYNPPTVEDVKPLLNMQQSYNPPQSNDTQAIQWMV